NLFVRETCALHSLVLSIGQSLLQNGLFQRGKVRSSFIPLPFRVVGELPPMAGDTLSSLC
ncbi:hypothetical protein, partial [Rhizobium rhizogenes]|uniref:hypothetical protein n=1 Tax=Rhizobium rhizogenes TaxID=359 RepID=UPI001AEE743C